LKSENGQSAPLRIKLTDKVRPKTLFVTFHHASSRINALFGDRSDELIMTAAFKSVKVEVIPVK
jgi:formate dehydrogenase major subunit